MSEHIRISKKAVYTILVVILLVAAALVYFLYYQPKMEKAKEIDYYKKVLFDSTYCQYSCTLTQQDFQGEMQLLPELTCVQACVEDLKTKGLDPGKFSDFDLKNDMLIGDIQTAIEGCRTEAMVDEKIDNQLFFDCSTRELSALRTKYNYLA